MPQECWGWCTEHPTKTVKKRRVYQDEVSQYSYADICVDDIGKCYGLKGWKAS